MLPFLLPAWSFIKGISPKTWLIIGACVLILFFGKLYGDRRYNQGKIDTMDYIEKEKKDEWEAKDKELDQIKANLAAEKDSLALEREAITKERTNMYSVLAENIREIRNERLRGYETAATVPDDRIWNDIRVVSRQLATDSR
jgi:type IV secretory pathway VirB4 component